jgi:hypothetical protein
MSATLGNGTVTFGDGTVQSTAAPAKAWASFCGTPSSGSATIYGSYNISSITINSTGYFTVNFSSALVDGNYAVVGNASTEAGTDPFITVELFSSGGSTPIAPTSSSFVFSTGQPNYPLRNPTYISIVVFR